MPCRETELDQLMVVQMLRAVTTCRRNGAIRDEFVGRGSAPLTVGQPFGIRPLRKSLPGSGCRSPAARQSAMLLQLILGLAQMAHPQDHQFGVPRAIGPSTATNLRRADGSTSWTGCNQGVEQMELRVPDAARTDRADDALISPTSRTPRVTSPSRFGRTHAGRTRYGDTVLRCSSMSTRDPVPGRRAAGSCRVRTPAASADRGGDEGRQSGPIPRVDEPVCMTQFATQADGKGLSRLTIPVARRSTVRAALVAPVGHLRDLDADLARIGERP